MKVIEYELACVASVSAWFRSKERPRKDERGTGLVLAAQKMERDPLPALLLAPFFEQSLTLVPQSLLQNRMETLAKQAKINNMSLLAYDQDTHSVPCIHVYLVVQSFSFCFKLITIHYHTPKQREIKFTPRIKLNHYRYTTNIKSTA